MQLLHMECRHGNNCEFVSAFREILQVPQVPNPVSIPTKSGEGIGDIAVGIFLQKSWSCCVARLRPAEVTKLAIVTSRKDQNNQEQKRPDKPI